MEQVEIPLVPLGEESRHCKQLGKGLFKCSGHIFYMAGKQEKQKKGEVLKKGTLYIYIYAVFRCDNIFVLPFKELNRRKQ